MNDMGMTAAEGIVLGCLCGLYTVRNTETGKEYRCRAKGTFRHDGLSPLVGDRVRITVPSEPSDGIRLEEILPRKNALLRPAMANLDVLFFVIAAAEPDPSLRFIDKMLCILEYQHIEPVPVITKCDLSPALAEKLRVKYEKCGFTVFLTDSETYAGDDGIRAYLQGLPENSTAAFSGVSGAGKSTLLNRLFPALSLKTGELSEKIARGRHTTRAVELYPLTLEAGKNLFLADTPGFSMLDYERFDFFPAKELAYTFREFVPYLGHCRYTDCTHSAEDGCAVLSAVGERKIPASRHKSYRELYDILKKKT